MSATPELPRTGSITLDQPDHGSTAPSHVSREAIVENDPEHYHGHLDDVLLATQTFARTSHGTAAECPIQRW